MRRLLIHTMSAATRQQLEEAEITKLEAECVFTFLPLDAIARAFNNGERFDLFVADVQSPHCWLSCDAIAQTGWRTQILFVSCLDELRLRLRITDYNYAGFLRLPQEQAQIFPLLKLLLEQS